MLKDITHNNGEFKYPVVKIDPGREQVDQPAQSAVLKHRSIIPRGERERESRWLFYERSTSARCSYRGVTSCR